MLLLFGTQNVTEMKENMFGKLEQLQSEADDTRNNLKKKTFDLQTVSDVSQDMGSLGDIREIMENLLMMAMGNLGALGGVILLVDPKKKKIETIFQRGMDDASMDKLFSTIESGLYKELERSNDVEITGNEDRNGKESGGKDFVLLSSLNMNIWIPFDAGEGLCGGIGLGDRLSGASYNRDDWELLRTLSSQGALAIKNIQSARLKEKEAELGRYLRGAKEYKYSNIVAKSKIMRVLLEEIDNLSKIDNPVMVFGEAGVGKELMARKIHSDSDRAELPIIEYTLPQERRKWKTEDVVKQGRSGSLERRLRDNVECKLFGTAETASSNDDGRKIGFFELVDKGTIIIKNIENMPLSTQTKVLKFLETGCFSRVGGNETVHADVRIIVTTKDINTAERQMESSFFCLLSSFKLEIPPLRDHKRDIPFLMEHFAEKICEIKHLQTIKFSKEAVNKLLKYDYPGNVDELEKVIERAVELSKEDAIVEEEVIFLGDTDVESKIRFNLLDIPLIRRICESNKLMATLKIALLIFFLVILCLTIIHPDVLAGGKSAVLILCWRIGLPLLFITFLFAARFGCGICPINCISRFFNKYFSLKIPIPSLIKKNDVWIMGTGFIAILFLESYTHMADSVNKTAYLLFSILFAALIADFIFEKSAWCRHLCPLGGLGSIFSMSSMIEIRANKHTCTTICKTHDCFKGTDKVEPCPMFLHLQFLSDNRDCKVCLNCIKSCKNNAARLNVRIPGVEIASLSQPSFAGAMMSILLSGLLVAEIFSKLDISQRYFFYLFLLSTFAALNLNCISNYLTAIVSRNSFREELSHFGYTLLPLTLFGHIALKFMEIFEGVKGSFHLLGIYQVHYNLTFIIQSLLVIAGLSLTEYLIYKIVQNKFSTRRKIQILIIQGTVPLIFAICYISLFLQGT